MKNNLNALPAELLYMVCAYLSPADLLQLSRINQYHYGRIQTFTIWKNALQSDIKAAINTDQVNFQLHFANNPHHLQADCVHLHPFYILFTTPSLYRPFLSRLTPQQIEPLFKRLAQGFHDESQTIHTIVDTMIEWHYLQSILKNSTPSPDKISLVLLNVLLSHPVRAVDMTQYLASQFTLPADLDTAIQQLILDEVTAEQLAQQAQESLTNAILILQDEEAIQTLLHHQHYTQLLQDIVTAQPKSAILMLHNNFVDVVGLHSTVTGMSPATIMNPLLKHIIAACKLGLLKNWDITHDSRLNLHIVTTHLLYQWCSSRYEKGVRSEEQTAINSLEVNRIRP